jgi:hypothetical protein
MKSCCRFKVNFMQLKTRSHIYYSIATDGIHYEKKSHDKVDLALPPLSICISMFLIWLKTPKFDYGRVIQQSSCVVEIRFM